MNFQYCTQINGIQIWWPGLKSDNSHLKYLHTFSDDFLAKITKKNVNNFSWKTHAIFVLTSKAFFTKCMKAAFHETERGHPLREPITCFAYGLQWNCSIFSDTALKSSLLHQLHAWCIYIHINIVTYINTVHVTPNTL